MVKIFEEMILFMIKQFCDNFYLVGEGIGWKDEGVVGDIVGIVHGSDGGGGII
jgi:hypothetical protein